MYQIAGLSTLALGWHRNRTESSHLYFSNVCSFYYFMLLSKYPL